MDRDGGVSGEVEYVLYVCGGVAVCVSVFVCAHVHLRYGK